MHYVSTCNSFEQDSNHRNANDIQQTIENDSVQNEFSEIVTDKDTGIITNNIIVIKHENVIELPT